MQSEEKSVEYEKRQLLYLLNSKARDKIIDKYLSLYETTKQHDYNLLKQIAYHFIEEGISSHDVEDQLLTLFGISLANDPGFIHHLDTAMHSRSPYVQAAALQLLANIHEDVADTLITHALKSDFLIIRFEALSILVSRQTKHSLGQVESLMNLLPPQLKPYFTEFFAIHQSPEATSKLKLLMSDKDYNVRKTAILYSAKHRHDELIPNIRLALSHSDPSVKETASFALGLLRDSNSIQNLKITKESPFQETRLAALVALARLGEMEYIQEIIEMAKKDNTYAIYALREFPESTGELYPLIFRAGDDVRLNAALTLLDHRDPKCLRVINDVLFADPEHISFVPQISPGNAFSSWKISSPAAFSNADIKRNMKAITIQLQEDTLQKCVDLPKEDFIHIAKSILNSKHKQLVPLLIHLLENQHSDEALQLLKDGTKAIGSPFIRAYCTLGLYRLGESENATLQFHNWLSKQEIKQLIEFKPMLDRNARSDKNSSNYHLSPEEESALFIEAFLTVADRHEDAGITLLLKAMKGGHEKNCYPLAGVLLKSIL